MFAEVILDENIERFVAYINSLRAKITIHSAKKTSITLLLVEKVIIPIKYSDFTDVFLKKLAKV